VSERTNTGRPAHRPAKSPIPPMEASISCPGPQPPASHEGQAHRRAKLPASFALPKALQVVSEADVAAADVAAAHIASAEVPASGITARVARIALGTTVSFVAGLVAAELREQ
jgi:hypothetical protein